MKKRQRMRLTWKHLTPLCALAFLCPASVYAEGRQYQCSFPSFAQPEGIEAAKDFNLEFAFDTQTNEAFIVGNNGVSKVFPVQGSGGITFLEPLATGAVQTTTVSLDGGAVHSRHTIIGDELVPTQYYGTCEVQN